jgi:DNA (cytosine-5)-methyltransferase 3A
VKKGIVVLSLFDGMSCGRIALDRAGIKVKKYYASEIDKYAQIVSEKNYPDIVRLGDITKWREWKIEKPDMIIGGSPCQGFSFAGKGLNFEDERSKLFFTFVDILKHYKPKYFLLENVKMKKEYQKVISDCLGVEPIEINSALVSAQNRRRLYWTNIKNVTQPDDKGILLKDIIDGQAFINDCGKMKVQHLKSNCIDANYHKGMDNHGQRTLIRVTKDGFHQYRNDKKKSSIQGTHVTYPTGKSHCLTCNGHIPKTTCAVIGTTGRGKYESKNRVYSTAAKSPTVLAHKTGGWDDVKISENNLTWRKLTPLECERLQTVPDNYTNHVSNTQRYKMLGNGWTVDVIAHIFRGLK